MVDSIDKSPPTAIGEFLKLEAAAGLLLVIAGLRLRECRRQRSP